jgi:branched-chain amino acid transport system ATP-binding protein
MLAIGRALMTEPRVLLLDEPSMGLAPAIVDQVFEAIVTLHRQGQAILLVEQNAEIALSVCDYAYLVKRGSIVAQGTVDALRADEGVLDAYLA